MTALLTQPSGWRTAEAAVLAFFSRTSEYPCPPEHLNLSTIRALEQRHGLPVGFSDHSSGIAMAPLFAVAAGARLIEKHVTFDKTRQGFDHPISLSADEFATMVAAVRLAEIVLGQPEKIADNLFSNRQNDISGVQQQHMILLPGTDFH